MTKNKSESNILNHDLGPWTLDLGREKRPAVFLDRDGTIIDELGYLGDPDKVILYPGVHDALIRLNEAGYLLIVITNQSGVARGYFTLEEALAVNYKTTRMLADLGANINGIYFCPHLPDDGCSCRKPAPGMVQKAETDFNVDLANSWIVGDTDKDVLLGPNAGIKPLLLQTGKEDKGIVPADVPVLADLKQAVRLILEAQS